MGMDRAKDIWRNPSNLSPHQKKMMVPYILESDPRLVKSPGGGVASDFKWWGWSNGGKNQNSKKSLDQKLAST